MSTYIWILIIIVTVMALYLLFYTYSVARAQKVKAGYDSTIDDSVKEHPYLKNLIFVSLLLGRFWLPVLFLLCFSIVIRRRFQYHEIFFLL
ncbi:hypothetical protein KEH51_14090 [[Brevibacterium] frigoritolerans]|uniref:Uncharacterized protein n=1 Tax=Peribacillus frigoritolerans TaxID=450367 RepID=A0A941J2R8_9BACI|nr:hypothetical protein [Peribacillus frigoritolerans]